MKSLAIRDARQAWRLLNGVFCVYKPTDMTMDMLKQRIARALCRDLNALEVRPPSLYLANVVAQDPETLDLNIVAKRVQWDYSDHPLVVGPRYQPIDIRLEAVQEMEPDCTGLCPMAIGTGCDEIKRIEDARFIKSYQLRGRFGRATADYSARSKVIERTTHRHITKNKLDKILRRIQTDYHKAAFQYIGVPLQSQTAFELASQGLVRPTEESPPIFYNLVTDWYEPPQFSIELQSANESDFYLKLFVHNLGLLLKSGAVYSGIRRTRFGPLTLDLALLEKQWTLENILNCITLTSASLPSWLLKRSSSNRFIQEWDPSIRDRIYLTDGTNRVTLNAAIEEFQQKLIEGESRLQLSDENTEDGLEMLPDTAEGRDVLVARSEPTGVMTPEFDDDQEPMDLPAISIYRLSER